MKVSMRVCAYIDDIHVCWREIVRIERQRETMVEFIHLELRCFQNIARNEMF